MNNLSLIGLALIARWRIYKGNYGCYLEGMSAEQAEMSKKYVDAYRHQMRDNGGFLPSLWKEYCET